MELLCDMIRSFNENSKKIKLVFRTSRDGWNVDTLWKNCRPYECSVVIIKTDHGKIIGGYSSDRWENTGKLKWKEIKQSF